MQRIRSLGHASRSRYFSSAPVSAPPSSGPNTLMLVGVPTGLAAAAYLYYANVDATLGGIFPASAKPSVAPKSAAVAPLAVEEPQQSPRAVLPAAEKQSAPTKKPTTAAATAAAEIAERQAIALATVLSIADNVDGASAAASRSRVVEKSTPALQTVATEKSVQPSQPSPKPTATMPAIPETIVLTPPATNLVQVALETAHAEMRSLLYKDISSVLKRDFAESAHAEVAKLSEAAVREKVVRLIEESHERARLEGIRLAEFLERSDNAWMKKFEEFAVSIRNLGEEKVIAASKEAREELKKEFSSLLSREVQRITEDASAAVEARVLAATQDIEARSSASAENALARLSQLQIQIAALDNLLSSRNAYEKTAARSSRFSLAVSALLRAVDSRFCATLPEAAVRVAAGGQDALVSKALSMLPSAVHSREGVPTFTELRTQFSAVSTAGRRSAAAGTGVLGQALSLAGATIVLPAQAAANTVKDNLAGGYQKVKDGAAAVSTAAKEAVSPYPFLTPVVDAVFSALSSASNAIDSAANSATSAVSSTIDSAWGAFSKPAEAAPILSGSAAELAASANKTLAAGREVFETSSQEVRRTAAIFDAAEAALATGKLERAVETLSVLVGTPAEATVTDWLHLARQRIATDRCLRLLRAKSNLMHAVMY